MGYHACKWTPFRVAPVGEIEALALPEADSGPAWSAGDKAGFNTRIFVSDKSGMAGGPAGDSQRAPRRQRRIWESPSGVDISHP